MAQVEPTDEVIPYSLYGTQGRIDQLERYNTGNKYGEMTPKQLTNYLNQLDDGYLDDWIEICNYMQETDADLYSPIQTRIDRVIEANALIVPAKSTDSLSQQYASAAADFVRDVLSEINGWDGILRSILQAIANGVTTHELQWTRSGGANVISGMLWRHARRFRWDEDWTLRLYDYGQKGTNGERLWFDKWVVHVSKTTDGYPSKAGVCRGCAWPWLFRRWVTRYRMHATEKWGQPHTYAYVPENTKKATKLEVLDSLENLSYDSAAVFEQGTQIVFEGGPGIAGDGEIFQKFLDHAASQFSKHILGAEDITTPGTHGSQSAVETRVEATLDPRTANDAKALAVTLREQVFEPLCRLNLAQFGGVMPPVPKMVYKELEKPERMPEVQTQEPTAQTGRMAASRIPKALPPRGGSPDSTTGPSQTTLDFSHSQNPLKSLLSDG